MENKNIKNEFQINDLISLRLEEDKTIIYINNKKFEQCKYLLLHIPIESIEEYDEIKSIDEAAEKLDHSLENKNNSYKIPPDIEFWGHCSNLQGWVENNYDSNLLHMNLAFPLLKALSDEGDQLAKQKFKEEIAKRYKSGNYNVQAFLFNERYLRYLTNSEVLSGVLSTKDAIFMEKIKESRNCYSLIPCFDLIRDLVRNNELFMSVKNGKIIELEIELINKFTTIPKEIENLEGLERLFIYCEG